MIDTVIYQCACAKLPDFFASGLKSDVIIVFLDPNFPCGAGFPAIREHYTQIQIGIFTFRAVSRRRRASVCLSVCMSVRGRMPTLLHGPGCNLGNGSGCP